MPEPVVVPPVVTAPATPPPPEPSKFAGKYESPQTFEAGYRELHTKLGLPALPDKKPLFGAGGIYTDVQAAEFGYKSKETMLGRLPATPATPATVGDPKLVITPPATNTGDLVGVLAGLGLKGEDLAVAWQKDGKLPEDAYGKFEQAKIPRALVDDYMRAKAGQANAAKFVQTQIFADAGKLVGGDEQLQTLLKFGATLGAERVTDLNRRLGDPALWKGAVHEITMEYNSAAESGGTAPLLRGDTPAATGAGFTTLKDFQEASDRVRRGKATPADIARLKVSDDSIFKI